MRIEAWDELRGIRLSKAFYAEVCLRECYKPREKDGETMMVRFIDVNFSLIEPSCWWPFDFSRILNPDYWRENRIDLIDTIEELKLEGGEIRKKDINPLDCLSSQTLEELTGELPSAPVSVPSPYAPCQLNMAVGYQLDQIAKATGRYPAKLIKREKLLGKRETTEIVYDKNKGLQFYQEVKLTLQKTSIIKRYKKIS